MNSPAQLSGRRLLSVRLAAVLSFLSLLTASVASAAPPPAVAAFAGEWTAGTNAASPAPAEEDAASPDARRYWVEGDVVRGEIISWSGSMQTFHVAIIPRGPRFLKVLTPEGGEPEYFVGHAARGGVLWTSAASDEVRYLERVAGEADEKRFELLSPETENGVETWRVTASLKPAKSALTSVIGDVVLEPKLIEPVVYPTPEELEFFDRVTELVQQRDEARRNNSGLARELAGAWQEPGPPAPADAARAVAPAARLASLESQVQEAQKWSAELEKSLAAANTRADESAARVLALETELAGLRASSTTGAEAAEASRAATAQLDNRLAELAKQAEEAVAARADLVEELEAARAQVIALTKEKSDLETRVAEAGAQAQKAEALQADLTAAQAAHASAKAEGENLLERLTALQNDNSRLETALAAAEKAATNPAMAGELEEARSALAAAVAEATVARTTLQDLRKQADESAAASARLEQELKDTTLALQTATKEHAERFDAVNRMRDSAMNDLAAANERNAAQQARVAELEQSSKVTAGELAAAQEKLAALEERMSAALVENKTMEKELREARETPPGVADLETRLSRAVEVSAQSATALSDAEDEIAKLTSNLEKLTSEKSELAEQLKVAQEKPDVDPATATRLAATEKALADAHQTIESAREELARATSANASLEAQLADAGRSADSGATAAGALESRIAQLEAEAVSATELRLSLEREKNTTTAELALARNAVSELERQIAEQRQTLDVGGQQTRQIEADLAAAREHIRVLERRVAASDTQPAQGSATASDGRIGELETRLAETYSRAEARQAENDQLRIRLASLQADRQRLQQQLESSAPVAGITASEADDLRRRLAEAEAALRTADARNADVMSRLSDTEVRLAAAAVAPRRSSNTSASGVVPPPAASPRAAVSRPASTTGSPFFASTVPPAAATPSAAPAGVATGRVQFRMPEPVSSDPVRQPPTRPADPVSFAAASSVLFPGSAAADPSARAGSDQLVARTVRTLEVNGFRRAGRNSIVVINGTPFRTGDVVDPTRGVRFVRIDPNALVFADSTGGEYRRPL